MRLLSGRGLGEPAAPLVSGLDLNQDLAGVDPVTLGHVDGLDRTVDGGLDLALHLHRFADQYGLAGLDPIAFGHQYIDHVAGHAGGDVTRFGRVPTGLAANVTNKLIELLEDYFFRHAVHAQVEVAGAVPFDAHTGDIDTVTFPVYVDHELGGHALGGSGLAVTVRDRQQDFGLERTGGALLEELAPDIREHGEGQHILFALGQAADLLAQAVHFRLEQIRRAHLDHVLIANGAHLQLGVDGAR